MRKNSTSDTQKQREQHSQQPSLQGGDRFFPCFPVSISASIFSCTLRSRAAMPDSFSWPFMSISPYGYPGPGIIRSLNKTGVTILLVEQNAQMALSVADRGYVLETGRIVTSAPAAELLADEKVKKAYLGG